MYEATYLNILVWTYTYHYYSHIGRSLNSPNGWNPRVSPVLTLHTYIRTYVRTYVCICMYVLYVCFPTAVSVQCEPSCSRRCPDKMPPEKCPGKMPSTLEFVPAQSLCDHFTLIL